MAGADFVLPAPETVTMSGEAARKLIGSASGDAALLYLYILTCGGRYDRDDAAVRCGRTPQQMDAAMGVLARLGLVSVNQKAPAPRAPERADELPQYTAEDISRELKNGETFKSLVHEVQQALGKMLSSDDLIKLFGIYDYLGLPPEVILVLINYCLDECKDRTGSWRRPTMRYIEKVAYTWEREGIFSIEAAEAYLKTLTERKKLHSELSPALGITGRQLSASEGRYVDSWAEMGFGFDAISIAYDRTVLKTGRLTWRYMDSIIKSWHSKGLHTAAQIMAGDGITYTKPAQTSNTQSTASATEEELDMMRKTLERIKGGN